MYVPQIFRIPGFSAILNTVKCNQHIKRTYIRRARAKQNIVLEKVEQSGFLFQGKVHRTQPQQTILALEGKSFTSPIPESKYVVITNSITNNFLSFHNLAKKQLPALLSAWSLPRGNQTAFCRVKAWSMYAGMEIFLV